jgi:hypothetical protein
MFIAIIILACVFLGLLIAVWVISHSESPSFEAWKATEDPLPPGILLRPKHGLNWHPINLASEVEYQWCHVWTTAEQQAFIDSLKHQGIIP